MKYIFRGIVVFDYDPLTKEVTNPPTKHGLNSFNFCKFIPHDFELLSRFFEAIYWHQRGAYTDDDLVDIEVD